MKNCNSHVECWNLKEHLKKVIKENTIMLNLCEEHEWEPDTSMTVMRCDKCGVGLNTWKAKESLNTLGNN